MVEEEKQTDTEEEEKPDELEKPAGGEAGPGAGQPEDNADVQAGEAAPDAEAESLLRENERLKTEVRENIDKALRATAELDNIRKRASREIEKARKYALEGFIDELLPVIDSMELGINASQAAEDIESLREGMDLTLKKFFDCLDRVGVKVIDPAGEKFDPQWHEAVLMQEFEGSDSGIVMTVMQKGYELNGRLVRPAKVIVAK